MNPNYPVHVHGMTPLKQALSSGKFCADRVTEHLTAAYWLHFDEHRRDWHIAEAHKHFAELAECMGYRIEKIEAESEAA